MKSDQGGLTSRPASPVAHTRTRAAKLPGWHTAIGVFWEGFEMNETQKTTSIAAALAKAQAEMGPALKDSENPHFKSRYADLASVMDACLPALNKYGIAVVQPFVTDELNGKCVKTVLLHDSGETLECAVPLILGKNDMQGLGSAMTYARRYGLMCMAGIAPEDDDGNAAAQSQRAGLPLATSLGDAWRDAVTDALPPNATPRQTAEAFAKAICADFKDKGPKALETRWEKHKRMFEQLQARFPDLADDVTDAYENRRNELMDPVQLPIA